MTTEELEALGELPHSKWPADVVARVWRAAMDARTEAAEQRRRAETAEWNVTAARKEREWAYQLLGEARTEHAAAIEKVRQEERSAVLAEVAAFDYEKAGWYGLWKDMPKGIARILAEKCK